MINSPSFSSSREVFEWLSRFINLESGQHTRSFRLDRMELLAGLAGHPERAAPVIHAAGSKGKGSVIGMITRVLEGWGLNPARYMSPHVTEYRERITGGEGFFDESLYAAAGNELRALTESLYDPAMDPQRLFDTARDGEEPTFFELLTLCFFLCARLARCGAMAVETGMGGRLDATNIVDPLVSVITIIELEHTEYLGATIAQIAAEKGGIIKPRRPLILAEQSPEALAVLRRIAAEREAPLCYLPDLVRIEGLRVHRGGTDFSVSFTGESRFPEPLSVSLGIPGAIQAENASLAILALKTAFPAIDGPTICRSLRGFRLPARFEKLRDDPPLIIDGAHTPKSVESCLETFTALYGEGGILLFGCAAGKNAEAMAGILLAHFSRIIITTPGSFKRNDPEAVYGTFREEARKPRKEAGGSEKAS
ncbi:MAG: tetrahydrofolate synthase, partial [Treponema sp.]|nr:tetrahydrofolate synthase [Treponema sp.]